MDAESCRVVSRSVEPVHGPLQTPLMSTTFSRSFLFFSSFPPSLHPLSLLLLPFGSVGFFLCEQAIVLESLGPCFFY